MHEMSLAESILQIIADAARRDRFSRVRTVRLEIGQLAMVEPEALRFSFEQIRHHSLAQDARLDIIEVEGRGECELCGCKMMLSALYEPCPDCGTHRIRVTEGDQMRVSELEVE